MGSKTIPWFVIAAKYGDAVLAVYGAALRTLAETALRESFTDVPGGVYLKRVRRSKRPKIGEILRCRADQILAKFFSDSGNGG